MGAEPVHPDDESRPVARVPWLVRRWRSVRGVFRRETFGKDALAGTILGIESVPDGLAIGLLAGVNPVAGIYAFLFGMAGAALATSSTFMAVQATSAMALIVSDTDLSTQPDPDRALHTLAMLTGVIMIVAGALGAGRLLRFVPTAVMSADADIEPPTGMPRNTPETMLPTPWPTKLRESSAGLPSAFGTPAATPAPCTRPTNASESAGSAR